ncbi:hypothetical protein ROS1_45720 [Roseibium sp. ROS1]
MGEGDPVHLGLDGSDHIRIAVPETGDRGAAGSIEIFLSGPIENVATVPCYCDGEIGFGVAGKNMRHGKRIRQLTGQPTLG